MGDSKKPTAAGVWPTVRPFVNGGTSGMLATCVIQPIDMIKVRHVLYRSISMFLFSIFTDIHLKVMIFLSANWILLWVSDL
ncbi:hypothetical protein I3842_13G175900 [Carya illinoinensis]|uniref:Uncharacterized protein n=1 Tax=Carya illinoinensis TaxID=32201 RepID=A0A922IVF0_CARIL|nr:hypothetical protein I3842_13G175900 [Carya illinoinensis]